MQYEKTRQVTKKDIKRVASDQGPGGEEGWSLVLLFPIPFNTEPFYSYLPTRRLVNQGLTWFVWARIDR